MENRTLRFSILAVVYLVAAVLTYGFHPNLGLANERYGLIYMVRGDAYEPFVRRALVPILVRATHALIPQPVIDTINEKANRRVDTSGISADFQSKKHEMFGAMSTNWSIAVVGAFFAILSLAGALFALRRLLVVLYHPPPVVAGFFPLLLIALLPAFNGYSNFIYDYPNLLLFTMAMVFIVQKQWRAYYVTFVLALLNKETAVLLPIVFAATQFDSMERSRLAKHLIAQGTVAVVVLGSLVWIFHGNPGGAIEFHLSRNVAFLADFRNYFRFERFGPCLLAPGGLRVWAPIGLNLPFWLLVVGFIALGWRSAPSLLKRSLLTILGPLVLLQLFFGFVDEIRDLYEALPVVIALAWVSAQRVWRIRSTSSGVSA